MGKNAKGALKILLFAVIIAVLYFMLKKIGFSNIYITLSIADKKFILLAFIAGFLAFLTWNLKWYLLVKEIAPVSFWKVFVVLMAGSFLNTITPGARVGGEPLRAFYLSKIYKKEKSKFFATTISDKAANTLAFLVMSILSMLFVITFVDIDTRIKAVLETLIVILFLVVAAGIVLRQKIVFKKTYAKLFAKKIYYFYLFKIIRKKFSTYKSFENYAIKKINNIIMVVGKTLKKKDVVRKDIALAFARWAFVYAATYFLFASLGYKISPLAVIVVVTLSVFVGSMMLVPGGMGFIEAIMISLYIAFGINSGVAATVAVIDRAIFYFYSLIAGGICFAYLSIRHK